MYSTDRVQLRKVYAEAWRKANARELLSPLESAIADLIQNHPEYQSFFTDENALDRDFLPGTGETNPFLHISLHMAVQEQISVDKPQGIRTLYQQTCTLVGGEHEAEHIFMAHLIDVMWTANQEQAAPDEKAYMRTLKEHLLKQGVRL